MELNTGKLKIANAGMQIPPLLLKEDRLEKIKVGGLPISGAIENKFYNPENMDSYSFCLQEGELLFLTTDGLIEEEINEEKYGLKRLEKALYGKSCLPVQLLKEDVRKSFKNFCGYMESKDDITYFILKNPLSIQDQLELSYSKNIGDIDQVEEKVCNFVDKYHNTLVEVRASFHEMLINALEHGSSREEDVEIKVKITDCYVLVMIKDQGEGFEWRDKVNKKLNLNNLEKEFSSRGRGIKMASQFSDYIWYNEKGNKAHLLFLR